MKKVIIILTLMSIFYVTNVDAENYYVNKNGVIMTESEYQKIVDTYSIRRAENLTQDKYNKLIKGKIVDSNTIYQKVTYNEKGIISEKIISKEEYEKSEEENNYTCKSTISTKSSDNGFIETSYKKLSVHLTDLSDEFDLYGTLTWKKVPACRSYDVFAFRTAHFSYSGVNGTQEYYTNSGHSNILYDYTSQGYKSASNGAGFSMNLKDGNNITKYFMDLNADLQINQYNYSTAHVWVTYQHAQNDLTRAQSMSYSISAAGLGDVVYYTNNYIANTYDDMAGIELTTPIP